MQGDEDDFLTESVEEERIVEDRRGANIRQIQDQLSYMQNVDSWILSDLTRKMGTSKLKRAEGNQKITNVITSIQNSRTPKLIIKKNTIKNFQHSNLVENSRAADLSS